MAVERWLRTVSWSSAANSKASVPALVVTVGV